MSYQHVRYWAAQIRAITDDTVVVTERFNADDVAVVIPEPNNTKQNRAALINSLERGGCRVTSVTDSPVIRVDATEPPLDYPHDASVDYE